MSGLLDKMQATPRSKGWGLLADALTAANDYAQKPDRSMPMGKANPVLSLLANAVSLPSAATTADRVSYGDSLMQGKGQTLQMRPETADVAMMAPFSPKTAMGLLGAADTGVGRAAIVWHGSPHKFDKFDSSKIGTGEGAQAYGHGLYLAENPAVAKDYAGALSAAKANRPVGNVDLTQAYQNLPNDVPETLLAARRDFRALNDAGELSAADRRDFLTAVKNNLTASQNGAIYKVDLPDEAIAKMLDWDKPMSQQAPEVRAAVQKLGIKTEIPRDTNYGGPATRDAVGREIYSAIDKSGALHNPQTAAMLRDAGIPGIRYLDGGSRGTGTGTSNFVVFPGNEGLLSILERNGKPLK